MDPLTLLDTACRSDRRPAVVCGRTRLDYKELRELAERIGRALEEQGVRPGDRVAALFPNCHLYLACYFAALLRRFVLVPLNTRLSRREMLAILDHSGARVLIGEPALAAPLCPGAARNGGGWLAGPTGVGGAGAAAVAPPGAAHLYYTSGTTGRPKGVVLTTGNLQAHVDLTLRELELRAADVWLHAAPMFHLADAWAIWTVTAAGGAHVLLPRFGPGDALDLIDGAGVTLTNLVPTMLVALLEQASRRGRAPRSLRLLLSGGAPIAPGVVARVGERLGCAYAQTYGLTETSPFLTFSLPDATHRHLPPEERVRRLARTGRPAQGVEVRVVRPPGAPSFEDVPADDRTVGEVVARGPTVTPGYWRDEETTRAAFLGGWFHTGDLGTIDVHGSLNLVDRLKDVILTGGETVYSTEVENALYEHPDVREAAVFAVPDDAWGESVRAAVVARAGSGVSAADLIAFCRERLTHYKCPRIVDLLEALPRTGSGKIDKKTLRQPHWRGRPRQIN